MEEIKTLYNTLYENPAALSDTERTQLVQDFGDRADRIISTGHGGNIQSPEPARSISLMAFWYEFPIKNASYDFRSCWIKKSNYRSRMRWNS